MWSNKLLNDQTIITGRQSLGQVANQGPGIATRLRADISAFFRGRFLDPSILLQSSPQ